MAVCIIKTKVLSMGSYLKDQEQLSCMQIRHVLLAGKTQACSEGSPKLSRGYSCELLQKYPTDSLQGN